jgi:hypothetical protein
VPTLVARSKAKIRVGAQPAKNGTVMMRSTCSLAKTEARAGMSLPQRTATAVCQASAYTVSRQGASLGVAARPTAGRSPAIACNAMRQRRPCSSAASSSGTLHFVRNKVALRQCLRARISLAPVVAPGYGGNSKQSNSKVSRCRLRSVSSAESARAAAPKTAPNPSIEGMPKRLRLLCTPHVKR